MLLSRVWRRAAIIALVVGFATFFPNGAHAASWNFESSWHHLFDLFGGRTVRGLFANNGIEMDPNGKPAANGVTGGAAPGALFANNSIGIDPNGQPSGVTGGTAAGALQDSDTPSNSSGQHTARQ